MRPRGLFISSRGAVIEQNTQAAGEARSCCCRWGREQGVQPQPTRTPWGPQHTQAGLSVASFPALNLQAWPPWGGLVSWTLCGPWAQGWVGVCERERVRVQFPASRLRSLGPDLTFLSSVPGAGLSHQLCHTG